MLTQYGRSDPLGRYYTKSAIGSLLVSQMPGINPRKILDLGAGSGSLSIAALERWGGVELFTVDIDVRAHGHLKRVFGNGHRHKHIKADALSSALPQLLASEANSIDAAVCNPPFMAPVWRPHFNGILEDAGFSSSYPMLATIDAATLFLAQNLRLINANATLGIILPDSLVSSAKYRLFRQQLLERYRVHQAVKLTRNSFRNTEALAHIVILSKAGSTDEPIALNCITRSREQACLHVNREEAIERLDFDYHQTRKKRTPRKKSVQLRSVVLEIGRGSLSSAQARLLGHPVMHTSHMTGRVLGRWCDLRSLSANAKLPGINRARSGDILLARVGRRLEFKVLGVRAGRPLITDCIYRIRVPKEFRKRLLAELSSDSGRRWIASRVYGVGARQLTKSDLLDFQISNKPEASLDVGPEPWSPNHG